MIGGFCNPYFNICLSHPIYGKWLDFSVLVFVTCVFLLQLGNIAVMAAHCLIVRVCHSNATTECWCSLPRCGCAFLPPLANVQSSNNITLNVRARVGQRTMCVQNTFFFVLLTCGSYKLGISKLI